MLEPQIARRCPSCGASIRDAASYCPQCGKKLSAQNTGEEQPKPSSVTAPLGEAPEAKHSARADGPSAAEAPKDLPKQQSGKTEPGKAKTGETKKAPAGQAAVGKMRGGIQRATTLARDVEGDVIHRVQKARQISSVVLDEAGYDPSLRFVLVACALFVVFLIIMLLNKFIS
jgi:hypothetical protein